jgi:hypothetical protein
MGKIWRILWNFSQVPVGATLPNKKGLLLLLLLLLLVGEIRHSRISL